MTSNQTHLIPLICAMAMGLYGSSSMADIYKFVDEKGVVNYSNFRPAKGSYEVLHFKCSDCGWKNSVDWSRVPLNLEDYTQEILAACERHGIDESLVRAIIHAESSFRHNVTSDMGAQGLMQLMPATAERFGVSRPFDPGQNIDGGVAYLKFLLKLFRYDMEKVAAAYNAGEGAVKKYGGVPPYRETKTFVGRVEMLRKRYAKALRRVS